MNKSKQSGNSSFQAEGSPPKVHHYEGFWAKTCMVLGAVHVIVGVLCVIMNGIGISFHAHMHNYAQGMWGGAVFFVTGFICVFAGFYRTPIPVKAAMAASIVSIVIAIPIMGITAAGLDHDRKVNFSYWIKDDYYGNDYLDGKESFRKSAHAMLLALSLLELVLGSLTLAITAHAIFYCNTYKGANQTPGNAMMFPKSSSPVPPEINMSGSQTAGDVYNISVPGYRYNNHDTSVTSDPPISPMEVKPNLSHSYQPDMSRDSRGAVGHPDLSRDSRGAGGHPDISRDSRGAGGHPDISRDSRGAGGHPDMSRESRGSRAGAQPVVDPALNSSGPSAFQQYPGSNQPAPVTSSQPTVGSGRGPPQPQTVHTRADTSQASLDPAGPPPVGGGGGKRKGPKLQVPHARHDTSVSSVETTGSRRGGGRGGPPPVQQPHQRHDMSYSSVDSYPSSIQGHPPPARTSSRSSNPGPYPQGQYPGAGDRHREFEGYSSHPGYSQQGGGGGVGYPGHQQRRV